MAQNISTAVHRSWYWLSDFAFGWGPPLPRAAELQAQLNQLSKTELVDLVCQMIAYYPDLEDLLVTPNPSDTNPAAVAEEKAIRRQVQVAMHHLVDRRGSPYALALEASDLLKQGQQYIEAKNWPKALTVYETVIRELLDHHDLLEDPEGELLRIVYRANDELSRCLEVITQPNFRQAVLRVLFDTYRWDVECGGTDLGPKILDIIRGYATPPEKQTVAQWLQAVLPPGNSWRDNFRRQLYLEGVSRL